jgi:hypothetical protein
VLKKILSMTRAKLLGRCRPRAICLSGTPAKQQPPDDDDNDVDDVDILM